MKVACRLSHNSVTLKGILASYFICLNFLASRTRLSLADISSIPLPALFLDIVELIRIYGKNIENWRTASIVSKDLARLNLFADCSAVHKQSLHLTLCMQKCAHVRRITF